VSSKVSAAVPLSGSSARTVVYVSLLGDLLVAAMKFGAAVLTGSSAMFSEGVHSVVDALTEITLLYGLASSRRRPTIDHQLGYGREIFWNFIVALLIFALGAGAAAYDGIRQIAMPSAVENPVVSYAVLGAAFVAEALSLRYARRASDKVRNGRSLRTYLSETRDVTSLTVLFDGAAGLLGLVIAAAGTALSQLFDDPVYDGIASVMIATILSLAAFVLARQSKALLIGVPATPAAVRSILQVAGDDLAVTAVNGSVTVHLAPEQLLVALSIEFRRDLGTDDIETAVGDIVNRLRSSHPEVKDLFIKPQTAAGYAMSRELRYGTMVKPVPKSR